MSGTRSELNDLAPAALGSPVPLSNGTAALGGVIPPHECRRGLVDLIYDLATAPTALGKRYLQETADNPPARKVRRSKFNGAAKVWSESMPFTQEAESLSNEYVLSVELAHANRRIPRFFFQPQRIHLDYVKADGVRVVTPVTPDCLVETMDGRLVLVEMASDEEVDAGVQAKNPRFAADDASGRVVDLPLTEACRHLGIAVVLLRSSDINHTLLENYLYLGKGFNTQWQPGESTQAFLTFMRNCLVADFAEVRSKPQGWTTDDVLGAIVHEMVYVDLRCQRLGHHSNARIYAAREHAEAAASAPESLPLLPGPAATATSSHPVDLSSLSDASIAEAWRRWSLIKPYITSGDARAAPQAIRQYLKAYQRAATELSAGFLGLVPDYARRGFRGSHLSSRVDELTDQHIERAALDTNPSPDSGSYGALILACKNEGLTPPSRTTFHNRLRERRTRLDSQRAKFGSEGEYQATPAKALTLSAIARVPQRAWQMGLIDHTPLPIRILEPILGTPMPGVTPWLTYMRDAATDKALGMYISLSRPSYISVMAVLWDCIRRHGRLTEGVLLDGEKPHDSIFVEQLLADQRIDKICRRFLCPRDGSPIERDFKLLIHGLLAYLAGNYVLRPNPHDWPRQWDPAKVADQTIASLYNACTTFLFGYANQELPRKKLGGMTPDVAMEASLRIHGERAFRIHPDPQQARQIILPRHSRGMLQITRENGVRPFGEPYVPLFSIDPCFYDTKVPVRFDPYDITYVLAKIGKTWTELKHRHYLKFNDLKGDQLAAVSLEIREGAIRHERTRSDRIESHASVLDRIMQQPKDPFGDFAKTIAAEDEIPTQSRKDPWARLMEEPIRPSQSYNEEF